MISREKEARGKLQPRVFVGAHGFVGLATNALGTLRAVPMPQMCSLSQGSPCSLLPGCEHCGSGPCKLSL